MELAHALIIFTYHQLIVFRQGSTCIVTRMLAKKKKKNMSVGGKGRVRVRTKYTISKFTRKQVRKYVLAVTVTVRVIPMSYYFQDEFTQFPKSSNHIIIFLTKETVDKHSLMIILAAISSCNVRMLCKIHVILSLKHIYFYSRLFL